jgi:hypothetical protein
MFGLLTPSVVRPMILSLIRLPEHLQSVLSWFRTPVRQNF